MVESTRKRIKLTSSASTGHLYTTMKNERIKPEKLELRKFDLVICQYVIYKEAKIKQFSL